MEFEESSVSSLISAVAEKGARSSKNRNRRRKYLWKCREGFFKILRTEMISLKLRVRWV